MLLWLYCFECSLHMRVKTRAGGITQSYSACLACLVQSLSMEEKERQQFKHITI